MTILLFLSVGCADGNSRPATYNINIFNLSTLLAPPTCHVRNATCRPGKRYKPCNSAYMPCTKSHDRDSFPLKRACGHEKRTVSSRPRTSVLQR